MKEALNNEKRGRIKTNNNIEIQEYHTDEDELARETDWVLRKGRKNKKKAESSPLVEKSETNKTTKYDSQKQVQPRKKQPLPINIIGINKYVTIQFLMKSIIDKGFKITASNNDV